MTTATTSRVAERFLGTGRLLRLFLRLDRVQIVAWTLGFGVLVASSVVALEEAYPDPATLQARAALLNNPAAVMMTGPAFSLDNYTFGAAVANELSLWVLLSATIMSVLLAVRHTRAEEESGRLEVLRALPVGRFAAALAAVLAVSIANLAVGAAVTLGLVGTGMQVADSVAFGLATALTGLVFGALTAVTAQLSAHAGAVRGMSLGAIAVAFVVRGLGDVIDAQGSWLSWLSPFAWAQQTRLYVDLRWWPLGVSALAVIALLSLAVVLAQRRDLGAGLRPARPGPDAAARSLLSPAGLANRLVSGTFIGWGIGLFAFAVAMGTLANSLEDMFTDNPALQDWVKLNMESITRSYAALSLMFWVIAAVALLVSGVLRLRAEEQAGRVEGVVVTGSSRPGQLAGWLAVVAVQAVLVQLLIGLGTGLGVAVVTGEGSWIGELTVASLAYVPAILVFGAVAVALYGLVPRLASATWALVGWAAIVVFLGELLNLPDWARDISPLAHVPMVPEESVTAGPLLVLGGITVLLVAAGFYGFVRRDVTNR